MFRNEAPYLYEWVQYHHTAGVDHFYMYDHLSTDNSLEVLQPFLEEGLFEVIPWPYPIQGSYVDEQIKALCEGIRRSRYQSA